MAGSGPDGLLRRERAGPGGILQRAGPEEPGATVLARVTSLFGVPPPITLQDIRVVRASLTGWGTTMVVLPDQPELPVYDKVRSVTAAAALVTAATGVLPVYHEKAWPGFRGR